MKRAEVEVCLCFERAVTFDAVIVENGFNLCLPVRYVISRPNGGDHARKDASMEEDPFKSLDAWTKCLPLHGSFQWISTILDDEGWNSNAKFI